MCAECIWTECSWIIQIMKRILTYNNPISMAVCVHLWCKNFYTKNMTYPFRSDNFTTNTFQMKLIKREEIYCQVLYQEELPGLHDLPWPLCQEAIFEEDLSTKAKKGFNIKEALFMSRKFHKYKNRSQNMNNIWMLSFEILEEIS